MRRPALFTGAKLRLILAAQTSDTLGIGRVAAAALSGLFSLPYWQVVSDALKDLNVVRSPFAREQRQVAL